VIDISFNFGQRRVQKSRYTYFIPLPADWVRNMNLKKGNFLYIEMLEHQSLKITSFPQVRQDTEGNEGSTPTNENEGLGNERYNSR
jgi:hypothetical protein